MANRTTRSSLAEKAGIGKIIFTVIIIVTVVISSSVTFALVSMTKSPTSNIKESSNVLSSLTDIFPISNSYNSSNTNQTLTSCYTGNWSAIYSQYETPLSIQQNSSTLGQQYLNDPQFMSFLSQYLNMSDPQVNATVNGLLSGNETMFLQRQVQSQGLSC